MIFFTKILFLKLLLAAGFGFVILALL